MKNNIVIISILAFTALLFAGVVWAMSGSNQPTVVANSNAKATVKNSFHDWGEIGIGDGNVEAEFEVTNEGTQTLQLYNLTTSCSCTNALYISQSGEESPFFGMHSKSKYVHEIQPGETTTIKAVFDPMFHGPSGTGSVIREVTVDTNDITNPQLTFKMSAMVTN